MKHNTCLDRIIYFWTTLYISQQDYIILADIIFFYLADKEYSTEYGKFF